MAKDNPMETFVLLLSNVRRATERSNKIYEELGDIAQDPHIKEALTARAFIQNQVLAKIDEAFKLINQKPVELTGKLTEVFVEDFRREINEIKNPAARRVFALAKAIHIAHWRAGEFMALIAAADFTGNYGVGVLLETCFADELAFAERTSRMLRNIAETRIAAKTTA